MFTVKTINENGNEKIFSCHAVTTERNYDVCSFPDRVNFVADDGFAFDNIACKIEVNRSFAPRFDVYVMNEAGETVGQYYLSREVPAAQNAPQNFSQEEPETAAA